MIENSPQKHNRPAERGGREAEVGFEPTNNGFAIRPLGPLGYSAMGGAMVAGICLAVKRTEMFSN